MPTTTTNLALPKPQTTDPFANGGTAIANLADAIDTLLGGAWTTFAPAITGGGVAITLNNGTLDAKYRKVGRHVTFTIHLTVGSTTTLPAGSVGFSLPVAGRGAGKAAGVLMQSGPNRAGGWRASGASTCVLIEGGASVQSTWVTLATVSGSELILTGSYESAA